MTTAPFPIPNALAPADLITRWPSDTPLVALLSADTANSARYSVFAIPTARLAATAEHSSLIPLADAPLPFTPTTDPLQDLTAALDQQPAADQPFACPLWIGALHYELGALFEPTAFSLSPTTPLYTLYYCTAALLHDNQTNTWRAIGDTARIPDLLSEPPQPDPPAAPITSNMGAEQYTRAVERTIEYIRAGDIFQANIAHKLAVQLQSTPRAAAHQLIAAARPSFAGVIETPEQTIVSLSPESLVDYRADSRTIETRPIKGTRSIVEHEDLLRSEKDAAELAMIVDLMRNDLGRVAEFSSVKVEHPRTLETHGGATPILHTTATIRARLRADQSRSDLLRAVFPAGSITGAPKVRAMQIINELEPEPRGPYCGSILCADASGNMQLSVAIRTATLTQQSETTTLNYHAGAGVVADSDPQAEWRETLTKSAPLRAIGADPETIR